MVSRASCRERKPTPRRRRSATTVIRSWRGAGEPVEAGDDEGVAGPEVVQAGGQLGPVGGLTRRLVGEHADAPGVGEGAGLPVENLPDGRHAGVADRGAGQLRRLGGQLLGQVGKVGSWCRSPKRIVRKRACGPLLNTPTSQHDFPTAGRLLCC